MSERLHERARRMRQRVALRAWEFRQRGHAAGTWYRLRRVLADAERAFVAGPEQVEALLAQGARAEPVGAELEPSKTLIFVPAERLDELGPLREIPVRLDAEMLAARHLVLVRFPRGAEIAPIHPGSRGDP